MTRIPLVIQEVKWNDYRQSSYYNFICSCSIEVCKRIYKDAKEKVILKQLEQESDYSQGYYFIVLDNNTPIGIASAYVTYGDCSKELVFNEHYIHIPNYVNPHKARIVLLMLLKALEQKTIELEIDYLCISCSNKESMDKYISILLKKGFNIETITCKKKVSNGKLD